MDDAEFYWLLGKFLLFEAVFIFLLWFWNKKAIARSLRKGLKGRSFEEHVISGICRICFFPFVWRNNRKLWRRHAKDL